MTNKKFLDEVNILKKLVQTYCSNKHKNILLNNKNLEYNNVKYNIEFSLCAKCNKIVDYSLQRLYECSYDIKPRCRKCKTPCYDKKQWRVIAKIMIYSSILLRLSKLKNRFKRI
jgi:hypothetical protein